MEHKRGPKEHTPEIKNIQSVVQIIENKHEISSSKINVSEIGSKVTKIKEEILEDGTRIITESYQFDKSNETDKNKISFIESKIYKEEEKRVDIEKERHWGLFEEGANLRAFKDRLNYLLNWLEKYSFPVFQGFQNYINRMKNIEKLGHLNLNVKSEEAFTYRAYTHICLGTPLDYEIIDMGDIRLFVHPKDKVDYYDHYNAEKDEIVREDKPDFIVELPHALFYHHLNGKKMVGYSIDKHNKIDQKKIAQCVYDQTVGQFDKMKNSVLANRNLSASDKCKKLHDISLKENRFRLKYFNDS